MNERRVTRSRPTLVSWLAVAALLLPVSGGAAPAPTPNPSPSPDASATPLSDLSVVIDGTAIVFDQPPITRDGRVYVPLRGIFERLGAAVVFSSGHIAATAGPHTIGLQIGETSATVDGVVQSLDAPPIVIAGRTLVPLRFVSQALGAMVAYDPTARVVAVTAPHFIPRGSSIASSTAAPTLASTAIAPPTPPAVAETPLPTPAPPLLPRPSGVPIVLHLLRVEPAPRSTIAERRPELSATFAESVAPASLRIAIDGSEITSRPYLSDRAIVVDVPNDLAPGTHEVSLVGRTPDRESFSEAWSFTTRAGPDTNYIGGLEPISGQNVGPRPFVVSGYTRPHARVSLSANASSAGLGFSDASDASTTVDAVADANGFFEADVAVVDHGSGVVDVRVTSTSADGSVATRTLRVRR